jgi:hypothetical protein
MMPFAPKGKAPMPKGKAPAPAGKKAPAGKMPFRKAAGRGR